MQLRLLAAAAAVSLAVGSAHAGTLTNGAWAPSGCGEDPGPAPEISSKDANAYNKSAKGVQEWQTKIKAYADCLSSEAKADQTAIVSAVNTSIGKINDESKALQEQSQAAIEKLKKQKS